MEFNAESNFLQKIVVCRQVKDFFIITSSIHKGTKQQYKWHLVATTCFLSKGSHSQIQERSLSSPSTLLWLVDFYLISIVLPLAKGCVKINFPLVKNE